MAVETEKGVIRQNEANLEPPVSDTAADDPAETVSWSTLLAVFFMGLSYVPCISAGLLLPTGILQQIGQTLGDTDNILWIPGGWSVASAVSFSIAGGLSDIFGRRYVLLSGQLLTLIGGIVGCTAHTTTIVAAGSTIIGFGAGVIFVSYPGIQELLPNKYRGAGIGWTEFCINVPWGSLSVYLGTQLFVHASWRWCYYLVVLYAVVVLAGTAAVYYPPARPQHDYDRSRWDEFVQLDFVGLGLFAAGLTVCLVGITYLGRSDYSVAMVAATIVVGALVFGGGFAYDFWSGVPRHPIFPWPLFALFREFTVHLVILFVSGMVWQGIVTLGPQGTLYMFTNDPVAIGVTMIPANMSGVLGGWILPSVVHRIRHVRLQILFALVVQTVFSACYAAVVPTNKAAWSAMQLFGQCCFSWVTSLAYVASGLFVPIEELGLSAGLLGTFRSAGGSVGNAVFSTILNSAVNRHLGNNIAAAALGAGFSNVTALAALVPAVIENAVGVPHALDSVPGGVSTAVAAATATAFRNTYAQAFRLVFFSMIPFGVLALGCAWFVRDPSHLLNNHVAVHQEKEVLAGIDHTNATAGQGHNHRSL
ncbi:Fungal trichothecene efflux pump [Niveomyces insectorum RCEF 264]|uniref:Fungal trichothecene efflux pump n=1 Tax=Niveomyces insectorum RCEF 264 TaxID=1081102 RepID=A0A162MRM3_9HYPO|nr:Fungal trichothecene efflux pump [Niveomyces insectorum RCEF 264]